MLQRSGLSIIVVLFQGLIAGACFADYERAQAYYYEENYPAALSELRPIAKQGDARAQNSIGLMYEYGRGVEKDEALAVSWYRKAAEQGDAAAQYALGFMYQSGLGVEKDEALAVSWYRKAAEQGNAAAQYALGFMYQSGLGVEKDEALAVSWWRKAAEQGDAAAQRALGVMYGEGLGVEKDEALAVSWYRKAAEQGDAKAEERAKELKKIIAGREEKAIKDPRVREKAEQFKKTSKTNWKLTDTKDEMSGSKKVFANAQVRLGLSIVESKVECEDGSVKASFTVFNGTYPISYARGKNDLSALVGFGCLMQGRAQWVNGRFKANDKLIDIAYCVSPKYRNVVDLVILSKKHFEDGSFRDFWGMMFEIPTNAGNVVFYFPTADQTVSKVIDACK
jgi:hypothetical protein